MSPEVRLASGWQAGVPRPLSQTRTFPSSSLFCFVLEKLTCLRTAALGTSPSLGAGVGQKAGVPSRQQREARVTRMHLPQPGAAECKQRLMLPALHPTPSLHLCRDNEAAVSSGS